MKAAPFEYLRVASLEEAIEALRDPAEGDVRILAGGQSLVPLMHLRLARPRAVVDINGLLELDGIAADDGEVRIGALTRHRTIETASFPPPFDLLSEAAGHVGYVPIRTRGTFGGSIAHADPTAELPLIASTLDAVVVLRSVRGIRSVPIADFLVGPFVTDARNDEIIVRVDFPRVPPDCAWSFGETGPPLKVVVAAVVQITAKGRCGWARIAVAGVGGIPLRCRRAEVGLIGKPLDRPAAEEAGRAAAADCAALPGGGRGPFPIQLARVLVRRAVEQLGARPRGPTS